MRDKILKYGGTAGALLAIIGVLSYLPSSITPASAERVENLEDFVYGSELDRLYSRLYNRQDKRNEYKDQGLTIPKHVTDEIIQLKNMIRKLEARKA